MIPEYLKNLRGPWVDMQMKIRIPHQRWSKQKRTHCLSEFYSFPKDKSVFKKERKKESLNK